MSRLRLNILSLAAQVVAVVVLLVLLAAAAGRGRLGRLPDFLLRLVRP